MTQPLDTNPTKYQVKVGSRVIAEAFTRVQADLILSTLPESEKVIAAIVPVASNGNQVLLG